MKKKKTFSLIEPAIAAGSDCRPDIAARQDRCVPAANFSIQQTGFYSNWSRKVSTPMPR